GKAAPVVAGLLLGAATIIRESDLVVMIPAVLYLVAVVRPGRRLAAPVSLPWYERWLCPRQPPAQRNVDFYMWDPRSPQVTLKAPPGMNKGHIILDFDRRI